MQHPDYRNPAAFVHLSDAQKQNNLMHNRSLFAELGAEWLTNAKANRTKATAGNWVAGFYAEKREGAVLVVANGPSTFRNIDAIRRWKGDIIVADVTYPAYRKAGLREPTLVVCQDKTDEMASYFDGMPKGLNVAVSIITDPKGSDFIMAAGGNVFWFGPINPFNPLIQTLYDMYHSAEIGMVLESGNVTGSAVDIAIKMGYPEVCMIGNEMCFDTIEEVRNYPGRTKGDRIALMIDDGRYTNQMLAQATAGIENMPVLYKGIRIVDFSNGVLGMGQFDTPAAKSQVMRMRIEDHPACAKEGADCEAEICPHCKSRVEKTLPPKPKPRRQSRKRK